MYLPLIKFACLSNIAKPKGCITQLSPRFERHVIRQKKKGTTHTRALWFCEIDKSKIKDHTN